MDRTIHTAAAQERAIRGVDDGVDRQGGDVSLDDFNAGRQWRIPGKKRYRPTVPS
jgi:hypothetical protein